MKLIGTIERSRTGYYSIYPDKDILDCAPFGYGLTLEEAKKEFLRGIETFREMKREELGYVPKEIDELVIDYRYDISTLFEEFDFLNVSGFARYAGINASKMRQYASGTADPGVKASKKISVALQKIGETLMNASFSQSFPSEPPARIPTTKMSQIKNEKQYKALLDRIDEIFSTTDENTPTDDPRLLELDVLSSLVEEYEKEQSPIETPSQFHSERQGSSHL